MTLVPQREYLVLLIGDACVFVATLWIALALRAFTFPAWDVFVRHLVPFSILFIAWALVFFVLKYAHWTIPDDGSCILDRQFK